MANQGPIVTEEDLLDLFDQMDTDKSGTLSLEELKVEYLNKGFKDEEIKVYNFTSRSIFACSFNI